MAQFPETRAAWRRLKIAWREWWALSPRATFTYTINRRLTPEEWKEVSRHVDAAFAEMDKAFKAGKF